MKKPVAVGVMKEGSLAGTNPKATGKVNSIIFHHTNNYNRDYENVKLFYGIAYYSIHSEDVSYQ